MLFLKQRAATFVAMKSTIFLLCLFFASIHAGTTRIVSFPSKAGFVKDVIILEEELSLLEIAVEKQFLPEMVQSEEHAIVDVQIFIQEFDERLLPFGKKNYLIPNPEWCWDTTESLQKVDLILARTKEVERIYTDVGLPVYYLGFTGVDQLMEGTPKNFCEYFHLKGFSPHKSAHEIVAAWTQGFPHLTVVDHWPNYKKVAKQITILADYITDQEMKWLQNKSGVHLCPSQTEGFGHYMAEAMSVGSVVITTDAPPMNEFITDKRFLIPYNHTSKHGWATVYVLSPKDIRKKIHAVQQIPFQELKKIGEDNRARYLQLKSDFKERLKILMEMP